MPLEDEQLIIEPSYPKAAELMAICGPRPTGDPLPDPDEGWRIRNQWHSHRERCNILIVERAGEIRAVREPAFHHITMDMHTLGCSIAWGLEQEQRALQLLGTMVRHHQMRQYVLTGMFLEQSARSGVTYMFRRLKPTVALAAHPGLPPAKSHMRILASLCMHPIAYYAGTWAGAMCPTDDVIAHLALMRGDERLFWARCNQHDPRRPEAGL